MTAKRPEFESQFDSSTSAKALFEQESPRGMRAKGIIVPCLWAFTALAVLTALGQQTSNALPPLSIVATQAQTLQLTWPVSAAGYDLERAPALQPAANRTKVAQLPELASDTFSLRAAATGAGGFFRLNRGQTATVQIVRIATNSLVPDALVDKQGILHMVYGQDHNAYYVRSTNNGGTFTSPVKVNSTGTVETEMGERGPKLAVGKNGVIHVIWEDDWAPGVQTFVRYSRSLDGGNTFAPLTTVSSMSGVDGVTMTADGAANVLAFWHVMDNPAPDVPQATWLFLARSTNNGASFGLSQRVTIDSFSGVACSMCMTRARISADGNACLVFRSAAGNIRDFFLLKGAANSNQFTAIRVNTDNWNINYCPMAGPEMTFDPYGRALCAFMTSNRTYWAVADASIGSFRLHVPTPANENNEIYPTVVANRHGEILFLWQVGPMSTSGTAVVKWARYQMDGTYSGQQGTVGTSFSGTKATAVVGNDGNFYIITSAR